MMMGSMTDMQGSNMIGVMIDTPIGGLGGGVYLYAGYSWSWSFCIKGGQIKEKDTFMAIASVLRNTHRFGQLNTFSLICNGYFLRACFLYSFVQAVYGMFETVIPSLRQK